MRELLSDDAKPELVTADDIDGLNKLSEVYMDLERQDVLLVRDDVVPEVAGRSQQIAERIASLIKPGQGEAKLGAVLAVSNEERELLRTARRLGPNILA